MIMSSFYVFLVVGEFGTLDFSGIRERRSKETNIHRESSLLRRQSEASQQKRDGPRPRSAIAEEQTQNN